ncbi:MAG: OmpA family protein [Alphaproteobacteria bacterium]|nr:OmpA family protein [Alphaproteobacteria bacterium]MCB9699827.1 OmpA family protein [Alphaproteobacteria bacterium]
MTNLFALLIAPAGAADVDLFAPTSSLLVGQGSPQAEAPTIGEPGFSGGMIVSYAQDPVVRRFDDGEVAEAVDALVPATLAGGWTVKDIVRVSLFVPFYAWVDAPVSSFAGGALGDLRLQANIPLWRNQDGSVGFGLIPRVGVPTGNNDAQVAAGPSAGLIAALGGNVPHLGWVANTDIHLAPNRPVEEPGTGLGSNLGATGAAWWQATQGLRIGAELEGHLGLAGGDLGANHTASTHAFVQDVLPSGIGLTAGLGTGLNDGIGSPAYRVFAGFHYTAVIRDHDGDGVLDVVDQCPTRPEDIDGFRDDDGCADEDNDEDGIIDLADLCPDDKEDADDWEDNDGCPEDDNDFDDVPDVEDQCRNVPGLIALHGCPDQDGDGVADGEDACPTEPGLPEKAGCPDGDRDGDGVPDGRDRCPDEPGPPGEDPATADGCPKTLFVSGREIKIGERIEFETGKAEIRPESRRIVDGVADLLKRETGVTRIEVQGHTDNVGSDRSNLTLSQERAQAVVDYLESKGIDGRRLVAKGYGESLPLFSNRTAQGREQNRRVQFMILDGATAGSTTMVPTPTPAPAPAPTPAPMAPLPPRRFRAPATAPAPAPAVAPVAAPVAAPVPSPAPEPAPAPPPPPVPAGPPGSLEVKIMGGGWGTVTVDGQRLTRAAPFSGFSLPSGTHVIVVENPRTKLHYEETITVVPDESTVVVVPAP